MRSPLSPTRAPFDALSLPLRAVRRRPTAVLLASALLAASACNGGENGSTATMSSADDGPTDRVSWAIGSWFSPESDGDRFLPAMGLTIEPDGTWWHATDGVMDGEGTWALQGDVLFMDDEEIVDVLPSCGSLLFEGDWVYREYHREDAPEGCPFETPALSAAERCLVGEFRRSTSSDVSSKLSVVTRTESRTEIISDFLESTVRDSIYYTNVSYWRIEGDELIRVDVDGDSYRSPLDEAFWEDLAATRTTPEDPGCVPPSAGPEDPFLCDTSIQCPDGEVPDCIHQVCLAPIAGESDDNACDNGVDDDGNGYADCDDFHCRANPLVTVCGGEVTDDACGNGIDDDGNGYADCDDYTCLMSPLVTHCLSERAVDCDNGFDEDANGYTDCEDLTCFGSPFTAC